MPLAPKTPKTPPVTPEVSETPTTKKKPVVTDRTVKVKHRKNGKTFTVSKDYYERHAHNLEIDAK